jgi:hypothetical protein
VRPLVSVAPLVVAVLIGAAPLRAQIIRNAAATDSARAPIPPEQLPTPDRARFAQIEFEAYRHTHLPHVPSRRAPDCSERIGTKCYWYAEGHELPVEPADIATQRDKLLRELESLAGSAPGNLWITEQRVRYLAEADRLTDALRVARECRGEGAGNGWRCEILVGFAQHLSSAFADAEQTYDSALSHMGPADRCAWLDMSLLLDDVARGQYRTLRCGDPERVAWAARTWSLARPLYSRAGNDARTEFFARMTMVQMIADGPGPYQKGFNEDEREQLLRFGWPRTWAAEFVLPFSVALADTNSIIPTSPGSTIGVKGKGKGGTPMGSYPPGTKIPASMPPLTRPPDIAKGPLPGNAGGAPDARPQLPRLPGVEIKPRDDDGISIVGMEAVPAYRYIPAGYVLNDPLRADSTVWWQQLPPVFARYAPAYAKSLVSLEHQQGVFKRGDSALVVMAYESRGNPAIAGATLRAGLTVSQAGAVPRDYTVVRESAPASGVLMVRAPWGPLLMSAEVTATERKALARARYGVGPLPAAEGRVSLSDLMFYRSSGGFPSSAEEMAPHALSTQRVHAKEKLGVYWEAYGTDPAGEKMQVSVIVLRENTTGSEEGGILGRLGRAIGRNRDATPVSISVDDNSARGARVSPRALALDISTLSKGSYVVQLEITVAGQPTLHAERRIEVVGP